MSYYYLKGSHDRILIIHWENPELRLKILFLCCRDDDKENMDDWDEEKLDEVIKKKHGSEKSNATDIVSYIIFIR